MKHAGDDGNCETFDRDSALSIRAPKSAGHGSGAGLGLARAGLSDRRAPHTINAPARAAAGLTKAPAAAKGRLKLGNDKDVGCASNALRDIRWAPGVAW
jgi:hypothetical protein